MDLLDYRNPISSLHPPAVFSPPTKEINEEDGWKYFRLCFAAIDEDQLAPITNRLAEGVPAFFRIKDKKTMEKLLEEDDASVASRCGSGHIAQMMGPC